MNWLEEGLKEAMVLVGIGAVRQGGQDGAQGKRMYHNSPKGRGDELGEPKRRRKIIFPKSTYS